MKTYELGYYDNGHYVVERYQASTEMEARSFVTRRLKRQIKFDVKVIEEVLA